DAEPGLLKQVLRHGPASRDRQKVPEQPMLIEFDKTVENLRVAAVKAVYRSRGVMLHRILKPENHSVHQQLIRMKRSKSLSAKPPVTWISEKPFFVSVFTSSSNPGHPRPLCLKVFINGA